MTARTHHLRYAALCGFLLLALMAVAWAGEETGHLLWKSLAIAPLVFAGTFLFNHFQRRHEDSHRRAKELEEVPLESEAPISSYVYLVTLTLGLTCVTVAVLAPRYLVSVVWVVPVLAGAAGIHLQAVT
jgi:hypothetical protein